ncbi:MAG: hypothetical protein WCD70_01775, partial [Alphaproteobacteria bacterium]
MPKALKPKDFGLVSYCLTMSLIDRLREQRVISERVALAICAQAADYADDQVVGGDPSFEGAYNFLIDLCGALQRKE